MSITVPISEDDRHTDRDTQRARVRGLLADRGFDPDTAMTPDGPTLGEFTDEYRRIAILEVAPIPAIEWVQRTSLKLGMANEVQDTLWRAYDRQARDEGDHGSYWGEMYYLLTGEAPRQMPWDGDGVGGSNVKLSVPEDSDDETANRTFVFLGSAYSLGLEGGFIQEAFPALLAMAKASELPMVQSFVPLMLQIGKDEARHVNIHKYAFHALKDTQGPDADVTFAKIVNAARRAFKVRELTDTEMQQYIGRHKPPTTEKVLGPLHVRMSEDG